MRTDELIAMLAQQDARPERAARGLRFAAALPAGLLAAMLMMVVLLGIREDWSLALRLPMFWWKLAYATSLGIAALFVTLRLATPGRRVGKAWYGLLLPAAAAAVAALVVLWLAPDGNRIALVRGETWQVCALWIASLSIPAFAAVMWSVRGLAPTRPRLSGACAGLLAGTLATAAYCVHCPEMQVPFWALWYTAGMLVPAVAGALLGPRLLRW